MVIAYMNKLQVIKDDKLSELPDTGYSSHTYVGVGKSGNVYCVASSPVKFSAVVAFEPETGKVRQLQMSNVNFISMTCRCT